MHIRTLSIVACLIVSSFVFTLSASAASPTLMDRVNEALRIVGLPVNAQTQQSFAAGVANGHYKTFEQLVNAMKWHKAHGKITATFNHKKLWVFTGTVTEVNVRRLEVVGLDKRNIEIQQKFRITKNTRLKNASLLFNESEETTHAVLEEIRRGSVVTVWATSSYEAIVIQNMAPKGQADFYGPVDCTKCGLATQNIDKLAPGQPQNIPPEEQGD